jgi:adenylate cyclase class 2
MSHIEYEVKVINIDPPDVRRRLRSIGAHCTKPESLYRRWVYRLPSSAPVQKGFVRVRDEAGNITLTYKSHGNTIDTTHEIELHVNSITAAQELVLQLGCEQKSYQETRREVWHLPDGGCISIDTWPWIPTFIEVEGVSEVHVREMVKKLEYDWSDTIVGGVAQVFIHLGFDIDKDTINNKTPRITFEMDCPYKRK